MTNVREYLESLKWDGKPRIATFFDDYATGANEFDATKWFISAVARAMTPGCKVDTHLVICGPQGSGKSKLLRALDPDVAQWSGSLEDLSTKWFVEMQTETLESKHNNKVFFTSTADTFRPAYSSNTITKSRTCIFALVIDDDVYQRSIHATRRFWFVTITACAANKIAADRDQLWAEAKHHFDNGVQWWD